MGIIIVDGRAGLQFKGPLSEFVQAIVGLEKLQKKLGPDSLMIGTMPVPDKPGIIVDLRFKGTISEFEKMIVGLEELRAKVAIGTVPLLDERLMIGTWPTPEKPTAPLRWAISVRVK